MTEQLVTWLSQYVYPMVFFGLWLDSVVAVAPGETLLIVGTLKGGVVWDIYILGVLGAWLGSYTSYLIGARIGQAKPKLLHRLGITPSRIERIACLMGKYGLWLLVLTRFIPGSRQVVYYIAGLGRMPAWKFHLFTLGGILPWAGLVVYAGLMVRENWERLFRNYGLLLGAIGLALFGVYFLWVKVFRRTPQSEEE